MNKNIVKKIVVLSGITAISMLGLICLPENKADSMRNVAYADNSVENHTVNGWDLAEIEAEDAGSVYCVGSVSKVYVTTAVMQLVDQGKVQLDAPVTEYIPDFKMVDERYKDITVRMLMNHTSGIFGTSFSDAFLFGDVVDDHEEYILDSLKTQRLKWNPGSAAAYCNDGFDLLQIIVERVTGMQYQDYVKKNISEPLGAYSIKTAADYYNDPRLTDVYMYEMEYDSEYVSPLGAGGIYSTALDTCEFGSAFFKDDNRLLSDKSKAEMSELQQNRDYGTPYGLGWDTVTIPQYEAAGVKTLYKSGGTNTQHTALLVAPDEKISVCVISSGGQSDELAVAESLMNIALLEQGIEVEELSAPEVELKTEIPEEYSRYEGLYGSGTGELMEVSSVGNSYMCVKMKTDTTKEEYYQYSDHGFVKVTGDTETNNTSIDSSFATIDFMEDDGKVYLKKHSISNYYGFEKNEYTSLIAEKLEINPASEEALALWKERDGKEYEIFSDKYSSCMYETPVIKLHVLDDFGYIFFECFGGSGLLKIEDGNNAVSFTTIPDNANRDLIDICVNGNTVSCSNGWKGIDADSNKLLTNDIQEITLKSGMAKWYDIDGTMANASISVNRPEKSCIYVYDRFGGVIYSSHMKDYGENIPLPKDGRIVFIGETGDTIKIFK